MSKTAVMLAAALLAAPVLAQYKVIGPDGKVTYTDTPPPAGKVEAVNRPLGEISGQDGLPYALRQVAGRYPVTLMTTAQCAACDAARELLRQRGVPYTEKTIGSSADIEALVRSEGSQDLPVVRIGSQQLKGFNATEWQGYLDAAGYPKTSQLPPGYRFRDPSPLVPPTATAQAAKPATTAASGVRSRPVAPENQPAPPPPSGGIRF